MSRVLLLATFVTMLGSVHCIAEEQPNEIHTLNTASSLATDVYLGRFSHALGTHINDRVQTQTNQTRLAMLGVAFFPAYGAACQNDSAERFVTLEIESELVSIDETGSVTERESTGSVSPSVRSSHERAFRTSFASATDPWKVIGSIGADFWGALQTAEKTTQEVLAQVGCETPASDQFGDNLAAIILGTPSLQDSGIVTPLLVQKCQDAWAANLGLDRDSGCACVGAVYRQHLRADAYAKLEDSVDEAAFTVSLIMSPKIWEEARQCR